MGTVRLWAGPRRTSGELGWAEVKEGGIGGKGRKTVVIMMDPGMDMEWKQVKENLVWTIYLQGVVCIDSGILRVVCLNPEFKSNYCSCWWTTRKEREPSLTLWKVVVSDDDSRTVVRNSDSTPVTLSRERTDIATSREKPADGGLWLYGCSHPHLHLCVFTVLTVTVLVYTIRQEFTFSHVI